MGRLLAGERVGEKAVELVIEKAVEKVAGWAVAMAAL